jgi:hypothetical protein
MSEYTYTVSPALHLRIWAPNTDPAVDAPWVYQPLSPTGEKWQTEEQASAWADKIIDIAVNPSEELPVEDPTI